MMLVHTGFLLPSDILQSPIMVTITAVVAFNTLAYTAFAVVRIVPMPRTKQSPARRSTFSAPAAHERVVPRHGGPASKSRRRERLRRSRMAPAERRHVTARGLSVKFSRKSTS